MRSNLLTFGVPLLLLSTCIYSLIIDHDIYEDGTLFIDSHTYVRNLDVSWVIHNPKNATIEITLKGLFLEECDECSCDYLTIESSDLTNGKMCDARYTATTYVTRSSKAVIRFISDYLITKGGFQIDVKYNYYVRKLECDNTFVDIEDDAYVVMKTRGSSETEQSTRQYCGVHIKQKKNMVAVLGVALEEGTSCENNDGGSEKVLINTATMCGQTYYKSTLKSGIAQYIVDGYVEEPSTVVFVVKYIRDNSILS